MILDLSSYSTEAIEKLAERARGRKAMHQLNDILDDNLATDHGAFDRPSAAFEAWYNQVSETEQHTCDRIINACNTELQKRNL